jgi:hypothetical protein
MPQANKLGDQMAADKAAAAGNENLALLLHAKFPLKDADDGENMADACSTEVPPKVEAIR